MCIPLEHKDVPQNLGLWDRMKKRYSAARKTVIACFLSVERFTVPPWQGYSTQPWCEDSRKQSTYPCRVGLDLTAPWCHGITSTDLHLSGVKPYQFEARECSTPATSVLTLVSLEPTTSRT